MEAAEEAAAIMQVEAAEEEKAATVQVEAAKEETAAAIQVEAAALGDSSSHSNMGYLQHHPNTTHED